MKAWALGEPFWEAGGAGTSPFPYYPFHGLSPGLSPSPSPSHGLSDPCLDLLPCHGLSGPFPCLDRGHGLSGPLYPGLGRGLSRLLYPDPDHGIPPVASDERNPLAGACHGGGAGGGVTQSRTGKWRRRSRIGHAKRSLILLKIQIQKRKKKS